MTMRQMNHKTVIAVLGSACLGAALWMAAPVLASDDHKSSRAATGFAPFYVEECASCHVAYPPGALPARSWTKMMSELDNHFGEDASVEPDEVQRLNDYLVANAAEHARGGCSQAHQTGEAERDPAKNYRSELLQEGTQRGAQAGLQN